MLTRAVWQVGGLSLGLRQRKASGGQKRPGSRAEAGTLSSYLAASRLPPLSCLEGVTCMSCNGREKALRLRFRALSPEATPAGGGVVNSHVFPSKHMSSQAVPQVPAFPSLLTPCP